MNGFEQQISSAKKQHFWGNFVATTLLLIVLLSLLAFWLLARTTHFTVKPDEISDDYQTSLVDGYGVMLGDTFYAFSEQYTLLFTRKTFISKQITLTPKDPQVQVIRLEPRPAVVSLTTQPAMENTRWQLLGKSKLTGSDFDAVLPPGKYHLTIDNPYFEAVTLALALERAQRFTQEVELIPVNGSIALASKPQGAPVFIDGEPVGTTPVTLNKKAGSYQVEVIAEGFEPVVESLELTRDNLQASRRYLLQPAKAQVAFNLSPTDGLLLVNGKKVSTGKIALAVNQRHQVRYSKPGFKGGELAFEIPLAQARAKDYQLSKSITLTPLIGELAISTNIPAEVFVDGQSQGTGDLKIKLPAKPAKVTIKAQGYRSQSQLVTPVPDVTTRLHFELMTEYHARRAEGKPSVARQLGIELMAFSPDQVVMGSKPNEVNRRRNEFNRTVRFSKPLLVSRHEISEAQFNRVTTGANGTSLPVVNITWQQAAAFCNRLSEQEGLPVFYQEANGVIVGVNKASIGYRLPSEAEWEWLAGQARKSKKSVYPWGDQMLPVKPTENLADEAIKSQQVFYFKDYQDGMTGRATVGTFKPGVNGLYDLGGNVSEWVHDAYSNRPEKAGQTVTDYLGPPQLNAGAGHVVKGGSFRTGQATALRVAYREPLTDKNDSTGFRIVRYVPVQELAVQ